MEVAVELEDDLFFADLSKQISLLIMEDDEDSVANCSSFPFQVFLHSMSSFHIRNAISIYPAFFLHIYSSLLNSRRISQEWITQQRHRHLCMSKEEKAKEQEFSFQDHHSHEGNTGKQDILHSTQSLIDSKITQEWFLKFLTTILYTTRTAS